MKNIAIFLCLICVGYYGWDAFDQWIRVPQQSGQIEVTGTKGEVFPSAMQHIVPINDFASFLKKERGLAAQIQAEKILEQERQRELDLKKLEPSTMTTTQIPIAMPEKIGDDLNSASEPICYKIGPILTKDLPSINRSIQVAGLLEAVSVEPVLLPDSYVVFIIPTTTQKGAWALLQQIKKKGYQNAYVIKSGPLLNAVQLGSFTSEAKAQIFYEEALNKLRMTDIRMTRLIGEPSNKVNLIFSAITDKQTAELRRLAQKYGQNLQDCGS